MKKKTLAIALSAALVSSVYAPATFASDGDSSHLFRFGAANVSPNDDSDTIPGLPVTAGVGVEDDTQIGLTYTYFWNSNWGFEILAATPFSHDLVGTGDLAGVDLGETKHLPPTFSVVYQWGENTKWHVGAGLNYTKFFEEEASAALDATLDTVFGVDQTTDLSLDASTGLAVKFGFDTPIGEHWNFNGAAYYMDIGTTADVLRDGAVATSVDVDIDPWVFFLGFGRHF